MLTQFKKKKFSYLFKILDIDKDGFLQVSDFSDFAENVRALLGIHEESDAHKRLAKLSVNFFYRIVDDIKPVKFQSVSLDEWNRLFYKINRINNEEILDEYSKLIYDFILGFFDFNNDGYISKSEYVDLYVIFRIDRSLLDQSFNLLDISGDERLSRYELRAALEDFLLSEDPHDRGNWLFGYWGNTFDEN